MKGNKKEVTIRFFWIFVGMAMALIVQKPIERAWDRYQASRKAPIQVLNDADVERSRFSESEITSAIKRYQTVVDGPTSFRAAAYRGLSRAYSDLTALKYRLGLARSNDGELALTYALRANEFNHDDPANQIVLAYAYDSLEAYQNPNERTATRAKVLELLEKQVASKPDAQLDVHYLAWRSKANQDSHSFPDQLKIQEVSSIRILVDVGMDYAERARRNEATASQDLVRATDLCNRAVLLAPNNQLALFCLGYSDIVAGRVADAQTHYEKALSGDGNSYFPRARNNLGVTYATQRHYKEARDQFEAAVKTPEAPVQGRIIWLNNLGESSLELGDDETACQSWQQAAQLPGAGENFLIHWGVAECAYLRGNLEVAREHYDRAVELGAQQGFDLTVIKTFESWNAGLKELEIAKPFIASRSSAQPRAH